MNVWQCCRQLKSILAAVAWADSPAETVLGSVHVTAGLPEGIGDDMRLPLAVLTPLDAEADPQDPRYVTQRFEVVLLVQVKQDGIGELALIGGSRSGGQGSSKGRGLLEIEEVVVDGVAKLARADGITLRCTHRGATDAAVVDGMGYLVRRAYRLEAKLSVARDYPPPIRLSVGGGPGFVALEWQLPPARYDRLKMILRRAAGATPPATATAGTGVTLASDLATSKTDTGLAAGTYSYALFAAYDETGSGAAERYSEAATGSAAAT